MSEPGYGDYIGLNYATIVSLARALIGAGMLSAADLASACRTTAESLPNEVVASELLAFAERWEAAEAGAEHLLAPGWSPEVIAGARTAAARAATATPDGRTPTSDF